MPRPFLIDGLCLQIFPASLVHVPTIAFHGCNTCFGPDHDGDCSQCADGFYFITTDEGTTFSGEDDGPTGVLESEPFIIGTGAQISYLIGGGNHDYPGGAGTTVEEVIVTVPDVCALTLEVQQGDGISPGKICATQIPQLPLCLILNILFITWC